MADSSPIGPSTPQGGNTPRRPGRCSNCSRDHRVCDYSRPHCSRCVRTGKTQSCNYDAADARNAKKARMSRGASASASTSASKITRASVAHSARSQSVEVSQGQQLSQVPALESAPYLAPPILPLPTYGFTDEGTLCLPPSWTLLVQPTPNLTLDMDFSDAANSTLFALADPDVEDEDESATGDLSTEEPVLYTEDIDDASDDEMMDVDTLEEMFEPPFEDGTPVTFSPSSLGLGIVEEFDSSNASDTS